MTRTLFVAALLVGTAFALVDWAEEECEHQNDCYDLKDLKHCVNTTLEGQDDQGLHCVECISDRDCPAGEICWDDLQTPEDRGELEGYKDDVKAFQCVKKKDPVGNFCDPLVTASNVRRNQTASSFCGLVTKWDIESGAPEHVVWEGECVAGKCYECDVFGGVVGAVDRDVRCFNSLLFPSRGGSEGHYRSSRTPVVYLQSWNNQLVSTVTTILLITAALGCVFNPPLSVTGGIPSFGVPPASTDEDEGPDPTAIPPPPEKVEEENAEAPAAGGWFSGWFGGGAKAAAEEEQPPPPEEPAPSEPSVGSRSTRSRKSKKSAGRRNTQETTATRNDFS